MNNEREYAQIDILHVNDHTFIRTIVRLREGVKRAGDVPPSDRARLPRKMFIFTHLKSTGAPSVTGFCIGETRVSVTPQTSRAGTRGWKITARDQKEELVASHEVSDKDSRNRLLDFFEGE